MSIIGSIRRLLLPSYSPARAAVPAASPAAVPPVTRRAFFSFFGVGAAMLAKPDLFFPRPIEGHWMPIEDTIQAWNPIGVVKATRVNGNLLLADVDFSGHLLRAASSYGADVTLKDVPCAELVRPGQMMFVGPGGQMTANPPNEQLWRASQKARGMQPDEVLTVSPIGKAVPYDHEAGMFGVVRYRGNGGVNG